MSETATETTTTTVAVEVKTLPVFRQADGYIEATAKAFVEHGLTINGIPAVLTDISSMAKLGFVEQVGIAEKPLNEHGKASRGPAPNVYKIPTNGFFAVALR